MPKYLDPKADLTFKKIFGQHKHLVMSLLNALLPLPTRFRILITSTQERRKPQSLARAITAERWKRRSQSPKPPAAPTSKVCQKLFLLRLRVANCNPKFNTVPFKSELENF